MNSAYQTNCCTNRIIPLPYLAPAVSSYSFLLAPQHFTTCTCTYVEQKSLKTQMVTISEKKKNWKEKTKGFWIVWCRLVQNQRKTIISCCWYSKWNFIKILGMDNLDNNTSTLYLENRSGDCSLNTSCNSFR